MTFATIFIFLTSTTNIITALQITLGYYRRTPRGYIQGVGMAMSISAVLTVLSIDSTLIYRCWIVYAKSWRVIFVPVIFWFASLACSALFIYYKTLAYQGQNIPIKIFQNEERTITGVYGCNVAITIYTTAAIVYRIWYTRKTSYGNPRRLNYTMRILAESGILYTFTLLFSLTGALLSARNDATWVDSVIYNVSDAINFSMAGTAFNLILIRVYQSRVELRDSMAESRTVDGEQTLSGMQFDNPRSKTYTEPPSGVLEETIDEIQGHSRSIDGMYEN
ncbi:hypothetical protein M378DRAFT_171232 [Amanita muscaria Koide BX008]|uniref:Uncharacterized protein n=1 Tax=Amanita muscaria (strain Koide BX008) TaxID=946122 RepID=A0A0C2W9G8_AMAMK|nr:hypothetical protein M378DRAFT_171232 [Amanita muscaria Koide BX008]